MEPSPENNSSSATRQPGNIGESMKDSMSESPRNNDNRLIPNAEELTDENGTLNPEAFKRSYEHGDNEKSANPSK